MRHLAVIATLLALCVPVAEAQDQPLPGVVFGETGYGGTGCPDGTAIVIASPDKRAASVVLRDYSVGDGTRSTDRKTCAIAVPVEVPEGLAVAVRSVAVRGGADLPADIEATLTVEAFLAGMTGEPHETTLTGPADRDLLSLTAIADDDLQWSDCGADVNLRVNTSLRTRGNAGAKIQVRAINLFWLATKAC